jgi:hypothetical protein
MGKVVTDEVLIFVILTSFWAVGWWRQIQERFLTVHVKEVMDGGKTLCMRPPELRTLRCIAAAGSSAIGSS